MAVTRNPSATIRLCLDPRDFNKAIQHTPYYVRTIDDVIPKVSGASHFSILDARGGFWQVDLDNSSVLRLDQLNCYAYLDLKGNHLSNVHEN